MRTPLGGSIPIWGRQETTLSHTNNLVQPDLLLWMFSIAFEDQREQIPRPNEVFSVMNIECWPVCRVRNVWVAAPLLLWLPASECPYHRCQRTSHQAFGLRADTQWLNLVNSSYPDYRWADTIGLQWWTDFSNVNIFKTIFGTLVTDKIQRCDMSTMVELLYPPEAFNPEHSEWFTWRQHHDAAVSFRREHIYQGIAVLV